MSERMGKEAFNAYLEYKRKQIQKRVKDCECCGIATLKEELYDGLCPICNREMNNYEEEQ